MELGAESGTQLAPSRHPVVRELEFTDEMIQLMKFCKEKRSFQAMLEYMGWKDRTKFRRRFISPLLEKGIIERTIPEKPSSSKQRYHVTNHGLEILQKFKEI